MDQKKIPISWRNQSKKSIQDIYDYIYERAPYNAEKFIDRLIDFGDSLADFPYKYAICRFPSLAKKNFRCAVFEHNYMFIYKITPSKLIIFNITHCRRLTEY